MNLLKCIYLIPSNQKRQVLSGFRWVFILCQDQTGENVQNNIFFLIEYPSEYTSTMLLKSLSDLANL